MIDISRTIEPKADQLNAEDFISGPLTLTIVDVGIRDSGEQPVLIKFAGGFRPWKPCKTMRRVLVFAWGSDASLYIGRSLRLYREPDVTWAGEKVGGIRIGAMSHIPKRIEIALAVSNKKRAAHVVDVLQAPDAPITDPLIAARNLAKDARGRGWSKDQIAAAMKGRKFEEMTPEELGTFMRDLMHEPGTVSETEKDGQS
jgi:hypothetical protein